MDVRFCLFTKLEILGHETLDVRFWGEGGGGRSGEEAEVVFGVVGRQRARKRGGGGD